MTEEIYQGIVPEGMEGMLFHHVVKGYESTAKGPEFTVEYKNRMVCKDGVSWIQNEGHQAKIPGVVLVTVDKGIKQFNVKFTEIVDAENAEEAAVVAVLNAKEVEDEVDVIDFSDLDEAAQNSEKGWFGMEVIELDFALTGVEGYVNRQVLHCNSNLILTLCLPLDLFPLNQDHTLGIPH